MTYRENEDSGDDDGPEIETGMTDVLHALRPYGTEDTIAIMRAVVELYSLPVRIVDTKPEGEVVP